MFAENILFGGHFCYILDTAVINNIIKVILLTYYEKVRVRSCIGQVNQPTVKNSAFTCRFSTLGNPD